MDSGMRGGGFLRRGDLGAEASGPMGSLEKSREDVQGGAEGWSRGRGESGDPPLEGDRYVARP